MGRSDGQTGPSGRRRAEFKNRDPKQIQTTFAELGKASPELRNSELGVPGTSTTAQRILTFYAKAPSGTRSIIRFLPNPSRGDRSWMSSNFWH